MFRKIFVLPIFNKANIQIVQFANEVEIVKPFIYIESNVLVIILYYVCNC